MIVIIALILTLLLKRWFPRLGTTKPDESRWNPDSKPTVGGIVFFVSILVYLGFCFVAAWEGANGFIRLIYPDLGETSTLLVAVCIAFGVGLWDDIKKISPMKKFVGQVLAGTVLAIGGLRYHFFEDYGFDGNLPVVVDSLCTIFIVIAFMNSVNMMDNMDAITVIAVLPVLAASVIFRDDYTTFGLVILLGGALVGFLILNWYPSQVFMGDSGSMLLGLVVAFLPIHMAHSYYHSVGFLDSGTIQFINTQGWELAFIILACPLFIVDTVVVIFNRLRHGISPFQGGKDHTSHHLHYLGLPQRAVAGVFAGLGLLQMAITYFTIRLDRWPSTLHFKDMLPGLVYFLLLLATMLSISFRNLRKGKYSYNK